MAASIVFALFTIMVVFFNYYSIENQFWFPELASNWGDMDTATLMTLIISGIVFVVLSLFICYCLIRFRHRENSKAEYQIGNNKVEGWLIALTTIGVIALLAPGLMVYSQLINEPEDSLRIEAIGEQWTWSFRLPGADNTFGKTNPKHFGIKNSFGLDPDDKYAQDDILIQSSTLHLPVNQPIALSLRSKDVLHDFYVPQFRVKMDLVPGQLTNLWFEPTVEGEYEILCAEYCGLQHTYMRGLVVVESEEKYKQWLSEQIIFANTSLNLPPDADKQEIVSGEMLSIRLGCTACHSIDGSNGIGPSWKGVAGEERTLSNGEKVIADHYYLEESIVSPNSKVLQDYPPIMPSYGLSHEELDQIVEYIETLNETNK